jgi:radical SAM superfamily enzyme YgiQ (UPF0313 family)
MNFHKILFVIPKVQASYAAKLDPHLGVAYLTTVLEQNNVNVEIFDFALDYQFEDLIEKVKNFQPDLIGITLFSFDFVNSHKLINRIKEQFNLPIILGGVHVSSVKEDVLKKTKADYALYGEAESSIIELCQNKPLEEINGLIYRKDNQIVKNPPAEFIKNLDELPFPAFEKFELKKYTYPQENRLQIATSRGCPYNCVYCAVKLSMGLGFRPRSPENVLKEIEYWHNKGYTFFEFVDDCFTLDMDRAKKICDLIIGKKINIKWNCANGIRADRVDEELLRKMKQAGCEFVAYGLETGSEKILKNIKKGITLQKALDAFQLTKKVGLKFAVNFIIGLPEETYQDALNSINLAKKLPANYVNFSNMVPYPGTETYGYIKEKGKFLLPKETYLTESTTKLGNPVFETPEFSSEERIKALKKGRAIAKKTHLQYRLGKKLGAVIYPLVKSDFSYNLFRRVISGNTSLKKIYNRVRK